MQSWTTLTKVPENAHVYDLRKSRDSSQPVNLWSVNLSCHVQCFWAVVYKNGGKFLQKRPSPAQNRSESKFAWIFQQPMDRDKYAYVGFMGKMISGKKVPAFLKSHMANKKTQE